jgi:hypothetical protein
VFINFFSTLNVDYKEFKESYELFIDALLFFISSLIFYCKNIYFYITFLGIFLILETSAYELLN